MGDDEVDFEMKIMDLLLKHHLRRRGSTHESSAPQPGLESSGTEHHDSSPSLDPSEGHPNYTPTDSESWFRKAYRFLGRLIRRAIQTFNEVIQALVDLANGVYDKICRHLRKTRSWLDERILPKIGKFAARVTETVRSVFKLFRTWW